MVISIFLAALHKSSFTIHYIVQTNSLNKNAFRIYIKCQELYFLFFHSQLSMHSMMVENNEHFMYMYTRKYIFIDLFEKIEYIIYLTDSCVHINIYVHVKMKVHFNVSFLIVNVIFSFNIFSRKKYTQFLKIANGFRSWPLYSQFFNLHRGD